MTDPQSQFYPPRAGFGKSLRWKRHAWRGTLAAGLFLHGAARSTVTLIVALAMPALGFAVAGRPRVAGLAFAVYALAAVSLLLFLGFEGADLAGGILVGTHCLGAAYFLNRHPRLTTWRLRIGAALATIFCLLAFVYVPAARMLQRVAYPLHTPAGPIIIDPRTSVGAIQREDVVAFHIARAANGNVAVRDGISLERVLGLPGDVIRFGQEEFTLNGEVHPRQPGMPGAGEWVVADGHRFIWTPPRFLPQNPNASGTELLMGVAMVPEERIIGKAFERWFWREQIYEPVQ